jgi:hypothetical protein
MFSLRHALIASFLLVAPAMAVTETAIRSQTRPGEYNNTQVNARRGVAVNVEFTGRRTDVIYMVWNGNLIRLGTLGQYIDRGAPTTNLGSGVFRVVATLQWDAVMRCTIELRDSRNRVIDADPVIVR